ncbi:MAG: dockerin type I domain-containing protein [Myxococcota bacterium]
MPDAQQARAQLDEEIASGSQEILRGTPGGPDSVGSLLIGLPGAQAGCTATLIGPNTALTAAHCFDNYISVDLCFDATNSLFVAGPCSRPAQVDEVRIHPSRDIAVLRLSSLFNAPTPLPISITAPSSADPFTMVGYGEVLPNVVSLERRQGNEFVSSVSADEWNSFFWNQSGVLPGDSGGPALRSDAVIGVASAVLLYDLNPTFYGYSFYERVDTTASWIVQNASGRVWFNETQNVNQPQDVNLDGLVDQTDFLLILQFVAQGLGPFPQPNQTGLLYDIDSDGNLSRLDATTFGYTNIINSCDVNADGRVTTLDALNVMNEISRNGSRALSGPNTIGYFVDVSGDGMISPSDSLRVINYLSGSTTSCTVFSGTLPPLP